MKKIAKLLVISFAIVILASAELVSAEVNIDTSQASSSENYHRLTAQYGLKMV